MDDEDFSFPTIGSTSSRFIDSPPLWRMSPAASLDSHHTLKARDGKRRDIDKDKNMEGKADYPIYKSHGQVKNSSYVKMAKGDSQDGEEEKMDMLWEDFNEESSTTHSSYMTSGEIIETGCGRARNLAKPGGVLISPKKAGMLILVKVLKRLLALPSQRSPKKHA